MNNILAFLSGKKTYLLALGAIIGLWTGYASGTIDLQTAIQKTFEALGFMTVRAGIAKTAS